MFQPPSANLRNDDLAIGGKFSFNAAPREGWCLSVFCQRILPDWPFVLPAQWLKFIFGGGGDGTFLFHADIISIYISHLSNIMIYDIRKWFLAYLEGFWHQHSTTKTNPRCSEAMDFSIYLPTLGRSKQDGDSFNTGNVWENMWQFVQARYTASTWDIYIYSRENQLLEPEKISTQHPPIFRSHGSF